MDVLILLVERRRQLVSRADIVERLWGKDVFVDVETGIQTAIRKIRQALGDSINSPTFVETVSGKGYRLVADVEVVSSTPSPSVAAWNLDPSPAHGHDQGGSPTLPTSRPRSTNAARLVIGVAAVAMMTGYLAWTWLSRGAPESRVTLAVFPFQYIGSDPDREYFAAGLTEETNASLAQIELERLIVKGRTSGYRGTTKTAVQNGEELSVDYLVESTIRAEGERLRVTATLIRVRDQEHVWSRSYDREPTSLLGLQQELSTSIAEQIRLRLSPGNVRGVRQRQTQNPDAYDAYLRARHFQSRRSPATNTRAIQRTSVRLLSIRTMRWPGRALRRRTRGVP